ncbi:hypothetical protein O181_075132 [Austropuccinia psidii MF-1]|uniref:Reverse transcriptase domain-containing protein n=1 Tax=Austropuccinia psidii MF-1 TaxID=1389203 RepID=A0A9Q3FC50_9BASI|nr:hypothetical protein [Austropuccinia psidii MF-1]
MNNCTSQHIILGNDYLNIYGIDINNHKDQYFIIRENKKQKFAFSNIPEKILIVSSNKDTYKEEFETDKPFEAQNYKDPFASDNEPLGTIEGNDVDITLNIERSHPPVLRRPAYPAIPRAREALEKHIQGLVQLGVLRKVGHNEEIEVKTPIIIAWNNDKYRIFREFGALNTYTVKYRYSIPRIQETLTQLSKAKYITSMEALKGFYQTFLIPKAKKLLRIITHCGIYEYLRMPFGIKNAQSNYQRMMNTIFPTELSEGWLIIYLDNIMICSDSWCLHLERLAKVLYKVEGVNMKISLKKCNFGFEELKALGLIFSGLSLGIDKSKVAEVLLKPTSQNKKEMMYFLRFASYYRQHMKDLQF